MYVCVILLFICACSAQSPNPRDKKDIDKMGELPWHVLIYEKNSTPPYSLICGGSIITPNVVISVTDCFWDNINEKIHPAKKYAVAAGKLDEPWDNKMFVQKLDVESINIPHEYNGNMGPFDYHLAVLLLSESFKYTHYIGPVEKDFVDIYVKMIGQVPIWRVDSQVLKAGILHLLDINNRIGDEVPTTSQPAINDMFCNGNEDNDVCGQATPDDDDVGRISGGKSAQLNEVPWHAGIYKKGFTPYKPICGGSLVKSNVVISAAHCFWDDKKAEGEKLQPASSYAVAVGKIYRPFDDPVDNKQAQKANVSSINIPSHFHGLVTNFMQDIAVLMLSKSFEYNRHVTPVCLCIIDSFDQVQLIGGAMGKVAGFGLTSPKEKKSLVLQVVELPIIPHDDCYKAMSAHFQRYLTADKICAGYKKLGKAVCQGDSGGGLVVPSTKHGITRYYLHGIVSTAPSPNDSGNLCDIDDIATFTHVIHYAKFLKNESFNIFT